MSSCAIQVQTLPRVHWMWTFMFFPLHWFLSEAQKPPSRHRVFIRLKGCLIYLSVLTYLRALKSSIVNCTLWPFNISPYFLHVVIDFNGLFYCMFLYLYVLFCFFVLYFIFWLSMRKFFYATLFVNSLSDLQFSLDVFWVCSFCALMSDWIH